MVVLGLPGPAAAKKQQKELLAKSVNTLHAYARDGCDEVALAERRIIVYLLGPEGLSMRDMLKNMRRHRFASLVHKG